MAPKKRLGVGAECTVSLRFLHPKDKIAEKIPNQTKSQKLSVLVVQERMEKPIRRKPMQCVVFRHEDFGGQPLWCMEKNVKVDVEGPKETFFDAVQVEATQGQEQATQSNNNGGGSGGGQQEAIELPQAILDVIQNPHLDVDDIRVAGNVAPMVDDDNMPAVENIPQQDTNNNNDNNDIMSGWEHSGICERRSAIQTNATPMLKSLNTSDEVNDPTNLQLFEALFFKSFIQSIIIPKTNANLGGKGKVSYGKFLRWLGLWFLMGTIVGPQRHDFWSVAPITAFSGAPLCLGVWMSRKHFDDILSALQFTSDDPPVFVDMFWEVRAMITAWNNNMNQQFSPGYVNCLDESMSVWTNQFTCPGFMFVPCKPWPFGNEYHSVCCCLSGIMWGIDLVEGKDRPNELGKKEGDEKGPTIGLLLRMLAPIFNLGFMVILDSGFCVLKAIIELRKKGVFASALIKK